MDRKTRPPAGSRPGTLAIPESAPAPRIRCLSFSPTECRDREVSDPLELRELPADAVTWIDVQGLGDEDLLRQLAEVFSLHPLALEDVVHVPGRPKAEVYDDHLLIISRMILARDGDFETEQVSLVVGSRFVLTFQERYGDILDPVRNRIRVGQGQIRKSGADYLAYAIWDALIDAYHPLVEHLGDELEDLEDRMLVRPTPEMLGELSEIRSHLHHLRRITVPQREAVRMLLREENPYLSDAVRIYLRDVHDHCILTAESIDGARDMVNNLMSLYLSAESYRSNEVMKVLTIVASIFVPLTFLAGVYGMNFTHMPELRVWWSYPLVLLIMASVALAMLVYFRRKGWIDPPPAADKEEPTA